MTLKSHVSDPASSYEAASRHERKADSNRAQVLTAVKNRPGISTFDVGVVTGLGQVETNRRLTDLKNDGLVTYGSLERATNGHRYSRVFPAVPRTPQGVQERLI